MVSREEVEKRVRAAWSKDIDGESSVIASVMALFDALHPDAAAKPAEDEVERAAEDDDLRTDYAAMKVAWLAERKKANALQCRLALAVEGLQWIACNGSPISASKAEQTLSKIEAKAGEARAKDSGKAESAHTGDADKLRSTANVTDSSPAPSLPDAVVRARRELERIFVFGEVDGADYKKFLNAYKAMNDASDAALADERKRAERYRAWAGFFMSCFNLPECRPTEEAFRHAVDDGIKSCDAPKRIPPAK